MVSCLFLSCFLVEDLGEALAATSALFQSSYEFWPTPNDGFRFIIPCIDLPPMSRLFEQQRYECCTACTLQCVTPNGRAYNRTVHPFGAETNDEAMGRVSR